MSIARPKKSKLILQQSSGISRIGGALCSCNLAILLKGSDAAEGLESAESEFFPSETPSVLYHSHVKSSITKGYQRVTDNQMNLPGCASGDKLNGAVAPNRALAVVSAALDNVLLVP